jgi:DDE superfamily endonuclease
MSISNIETGRVTLGLTTLLLSETAGGCLHDKRLAEVTPYPFPAGSRLWQDLGFLTFTLPQVEILMPTKTPCGQALPLAQQRTNQALHHRQLRIEHVNSSVKRCRIVKDRIRLRRDSVHDLVMELYCALHNFRVRLTPWQPVVESG